MTIQRNLNSWVNGDANREAVRRTIDEMSSRLSRLEQMIAVVAKSGTAGNGGGLSEFQQRQVLQLVAGRSSAVIGQEVTDPLVVGLPTNNGSVTSFAAGDLSPLFTTTETNPTTTPTLNFFQINQNANLVLAGPSSGIAAAPTFRALSASDFQSIGAPLLSSTILDLNTNTKQPLYTVPSGKSTIITFVVARNASVNLSGGVTANLSFGFNAAANDWANATLATALLTSSTLFEVLSQEFALGGTASETGLATQIFGAITDAAFGSVATVVIDIFGYLF